MGPTRILASSDTTQRTECNGIPFHALTVGEHRRSRRRSCSPDKHLERISQCGRLIAGSTDNSWILQIAFTATIIADLTATQPMETAPSTCERREHQKRFQPFRVFFSRRSVRVSKNTDVRYDGKRDAIFMQYLYLLPFVFSRDLLSIPCFFDEEPLQAATTQLHTRGRDDVVRADTLDLSKSFQTHLISWSHIILSKCI